MLLGILVVRELWSFSSVCVAYACAHDGFSTLLLRALYFLVKGGANQEHFFIGLLMCAGHCAQLRVLAHLILKITFFSGYYHHHHHHHHRRCRHHNHPVFPLRNPGHREVKLHAQGPMASGLDFKPRQILNPEPMLPLRSELLLLNC